MTTYQITGPGISLTIDGDGFSITDRLVVYAVKETKPSGVISYSDGTVENIAPVTENVTVGSYPSMCAIQVVAEEVMQPN